MSALTRQILKNTIRHVEANHSYNKEALCELRAVYAELERYADVHGNLTIEELIYTLISMARRPNGSTKTEGI